jgi:hypothetical protein
MGLGRRWAAMVARRRARRSRVRLTWQTCGRCGSYSLMNTLHSQLDEICANLDKLISGQQVDREHSVAHRNHAAGTRQARPLDNRLRWARYPVDQQLHLLAPAGITTAGTQDHAKALCGRRIPVEGLTLKAESGSLCVSCLATGTAS